MKCVILYAAKIAGPNTQTVFAGQPPERVPIFIRVQKCEARDAGHALDFARPREGEIVLNTILMDW